MVLSQRLPMPVCLSGSQMIGPHSVLCDSPSQHTMPTNGISAYGGLKLGCCCRIQSARHIVNSSLANIVRVTMMTDVIYVMHEFISTNHGTNHWL